MSVSDARGARIVACRALAARRRITRSRVRAVCAPPGLHRARCVRDLFPLPLGQPSQRSGNSFPSPSPCSKFCRDAGRAIPPGSGHSTPRAEPSLSAHSVRGTTPLKIASAALSSVSAAISPQPDLPDRSPSQNSVSRDVKAQASTPPRRLIRARRHRNRLPLRPKFHLSSISVLIREGSCEQLIRARTKPQVQEAKPPPRRRRKPGPPRRRTRMSRSNLACFRGARSRTSSSNHRSRTRFLARSGAGRPTLPAGRLFGKSIIRA